MPLNQDNRKVKSDTILVETSDSRLQTSSRIFCKFIECLQELKLLMLYVRRHLKDHCLLEDSWTNFARQGENYQVLTRPDRIYLELAT